MTVPGHRSVSYLPGRWTALVTDDLCVLCDVHLADPLLAACWEAAGGAGSGGAGADGAGAVLDVLARSAHQRPPSFVLVARAGDALRLVVAGRAHAEVFAGQQDPVVYGVADGQAWVDERLDVAWDVRLVADDPTPFERISPLPLTSGIVLASYVFSTVVDVSTAPSTSLRPAESAGAESAGPEPSPDEAVGWIPPPLAQVSQEYPVQRDLPDEPAPQLSGVFRALPWRSSLVESEEPVAVPASPEPDLAAVDEPGDASTGAGFRCRTGAVTAGIVRRSTGSARPGAQAVLRRTGYEPPPFGAEAFGGEGFGETGLGGGDYAYPPPAPYPPPPAYPSPTYPPPPLSVSSPDPVPADPPSVPLVQGRALQHRAPEPAAHRELPGLRRRIRLPAAGGPSSVRRSACCGCPQGRRCSSTGTPCSVGPRSPSTSATCSWSRCRAPRTTSRAVTFASPSTGGRCSRPISGRRTGRR